MSERMTAKTSLPLSHPPCAAKKLILESERAFMNAKSYKSILGRLLYLAARTRPIISTATAMLGKF